MQHSLGTQASLAALGPVSYRPEGGLNRIRCLDVSPVLGREVIESHQFLPVFLKTPRRSEIFVLVRFYEQVKSLVRIFFRFALPDVVQLPLGLGLGRLRQIVEHVCCLVHPAALLARFCVNFLKGGPKPKRSIEDCLPVCCCICRLPTRMPTCIRRDPSFSRCRTAQPTAP